MVKSYPFILEFLAGIRLGLLCSTGAGLLGRMYGSSANWNGFFGVLGGILVGYPIGCGVGIGLVAHFVTRAAPIWLPIIVAIAGFVLVILLIAPLNLTRNTNLLIALMFIIPPLLAIAVLQWRYPSA